MGLEQSNYVRCPAALGDGNARLAPFFGREDKTRRLAGIISELSLFFKPRRKIENKAVSRD